MWKTTYKKSNKKKKKENTKKEKGKESEQLEKCGTSGALFIRRGLSHVAFPNKLTSTFQDNA